MCLWSTIAATCAGDTSQDYCRPCTSLHRGGGGGGGGSGSGGGGSGGGGGGGGPPANNTTGGAAHDDLQERLKALRGRHDGPVLTIEEMETKFEELFGKTAFPGRKASD
jgi:hypothetical protein